MSATINFIVLMAVTFVLSALGTNAEKVCPRGAYLKISEGAVPICIKCTDGVNFMPYNKHSNTSCINCTKIIDTNLEILSRECNRTHDAEIFCIHGYYRYKAKTSSEIDHCRKCSECENPTLPCQDIYDTLCCDGPNYEAAFNKDGLYCKMLPSKCQRGQYLDNNTEQCRMCPSGTYMTHVNHSNTACNSCQTPQPHQVILQACNSTHSTIIGCEDGYFRDRVLQQTIGEMICLPCRTCHHHEGRACDMFHNTVCCSEPHMIVVDTDDGPECRYEDKTHTPEAKNRFSESQNDAYTRKMVQYGLYWWSLMIVAVLPMIVVIIIIRKRGIFLIKKINIKTLKIKLALAEVVIFHLLVLCLFQITAMLSPDDVCLWLVVIVLLIYFLIIIYLFRSDFLYLCQRKFFRKDFDNEIGQEAFQLLPIQRQDTQSTTEDELYNAEINVDFSQLQAPMSKAEQTRVYDDLKSAINHGANINAADDNKKTMLMYAAEHGQIDFLCFLLSRNAAINTRDTSGNTALAYAAKGGHDNCAEKLIDCGVDRYINVANNDGLTVLMLAMSSYSRSEVFPNLFINAGADVHIQDNYGSTALAYAVKRGHKKWVNALIRAGADKDVNIFNKEKVTATMLVVSSYGDDDKLLDMLLQAGADVNVRDKLGNTLLALAGRSGSEKCVSALIRAGLVSLVNEQNTNGLTPLMLAVSSSVGTSSCPQLLIRAGANIHIRDKKGNTALFYAVKSRNSEYVKMLIESGAKVNDLNKDGHTPLLEAVSTRENTSSCLRLLLDAGADIHVKDRDGNTAQDLAKKIHNQENWKIFIDWMLKKHTN